MKTIRIGTFETNSSSCHVIQLMNTKDWEDFKSGQLLIKKAPFGEIEEHREITVDLRGCASDNYYWTDCFMSLDDFVNDFYQNIEENRKEISKEFSSYKDDYYEFKKQIFNYIMDSSHKSIIKKIITEREPENLFKSDEQQNASLFLVEFKEPITCTYIGYKEQEITTTYKGITADDIYDFLFGYDNRLSINSENSIWGKVFPEFYSYNDSNEWKTAQVINFVQKEKNEKGISFLKDVEVTIIDRREDC